MVWYLDTSAFLKLIVAEDESAAMRAWTSVHEPLWSSQLLRTEAMRAGRILGVGTEVVEAALEAVSTILPGAATFYEAGHLAPSALRTLDALHLATALELCDDLDGLVTYDDRMIDAAREASMVVVSPR